MIRLNAESREVGVKSRHLRKEDFVPGVLYGKHMDKSIPVKLSLKETDQFLKSNDIGSKLELMIEGEPHLAMLKELTHEPASGRLEHLSFLALEKNEKVKGVARVMLEGREAAHSGVILQLISEIHYRALPSQLVDVIKVNIKNLGVNENLKVSDLSIAKDPNVEILNPLDEVVVTVTPVKIIAEEPKPEAAAAPAAAPSVASATTDKK